MRNIKKNSRLNKIKSFVISRPIVRLARSFFINNILPYIKYFFYFVAILLIFFTLYLAIFKKSYLEEVVNNIVDRGYKIINFNRFEHGRINIEGNSRIGYEEIVSLVREKLVSSKSYSNKEMIEDLKTKIHSLPWVDKVVIRVSLHDSINIYITEHQPFAIWQDDKKLYVVSKEGKIIPINQDEEFGDLIILTGEDAHKNVKALFNILAINPEISKNIYSATWVGNRRWDVRFYSGLLVKLPSNNDENNIQDAWSGLIKIYNMPGALIGLKTIDLRIAKKIYLEYDDAATKELKNI